MNRKFFIIYILMFIIFSGIAIFKFGLMSHKKTDDNFSIDVNRVVDDVETNWMDICANSDKAKTLLNNSYKYEFSVFAYEDLSYEHMPKLVFKSSEKASDSISAATKNNDLIRDVIVNGKLVGNIAVISNNDDLLKSQQRNMIIAFLIVSSVMILFMIGYFVYIDSRVVKPFNNLKEFANKVASGNLDIPLSMDKNNIFGPFSESFDIMREELKASKEREANSEKSRKELVASLSHDIKTPVASIKAMSEFMEATVDDEVKKTIVSIGKKADEIDKLISGLFFATMEELNVLSVDVCEVSSDELFEIIRNADYELKISDIVIKDAVFKADKLRLSQVVGNIITNSYKYANTEITIESGYESMPTDDNVRYLTVSFADKGGGVLAEEIDIISNKFVRGSNSKGKAGSGLGLYISSYLMEKMEGKLVYSNIDGGFMVKLYLKLI